MEIKKEVVKALAVVGAKDELIRISKSLFRSGTNEDKPKTKGKSLSRSESAKKGWETRRKKTAVKKAVKTAPKTAIKTATKTKGKLSEQEARAEEFKAKLRRLQGLQ